MVDATAADRVEGWIGEAVGGGATLFTGGRRDGAVLEPTLLGAPPRDAKVLVEEVFGDLVSIVPVDEFETAIGARRTRRATGCRAVSSPTTFAVSSPPSASSMSARSS